MTQENTKKPLIALVACPYNYQDYFTSEEEAIIDLGLGYLHSALEKKGYLVETFDSLHTIPSFISPYEVLSQQILEAKPSYIGFSDPLPNFGKSLELSRKLKEEIPGVRIIYGDVHASIFNKEILQNEPHVDFVVAGEGDRSLPKLIDALENEGDITQIPGLTYRNKEEIIENYPDFEVDLNSLPLPYRAPIDNFKSNRHSYFNLITSRGCPGHCTFCAMSTFLTRHCRSGCDRWRSRSAQSIFDEMQYLYEKGVRKFLFYDDNWIGIREVGLDNAIELCEKIIDNRMNDISIGAAIRPDSLLPSDQDALSIMKQAGVSLISFGLEASNSEQLKFYGKRYEFPQIKELIALIYENDIMIRTGYIMFYPYSTFDMLRKNSAFLAETDMSYLFTSYFSKLTPLSALPIEKRLQRDGLVIKPTTYTSVGIFKFQDHRMNDLQRFMLSAFHPEEQLTYDLMSAGAEASVLTKNGKGPFKLFMKSLKKIADVSTDLFDFCVDAFENCPNETEAIKVCYPYSQKWQKVIDNEKTFLSQFTAQFS